MWMDIFVHIENAAVFADVKGPSAGESCGAQYAIRPGSRLIRITENWIIEAERLRELAVGIRRIYTHAEAFGFEAAEHAAART